MTLPAGLPETLRQRLVASTHLTLTVASHWHHDAGPPQSEQPLDFCLHVGAGARSYVTRSHAHDGPVPAAQHERLLTLARAALAEDDPGLGVDTAFARLITTLTLTLHDVLPGAPAVRVASLSLNHASGLPDPCPAWAALVQALGDLVAPHLAEDDPDRWLFLLGYLEGPPALLPPFFAGQAVRCPDDSLLSVPFDGSLFLRVGQLPGPSSLLEVRRAHGGFSILRCDQGEQLIDRIQLPAGTSAIRASTELACREIMGSDHGYRSAPAPASDALWTGGEPQFRLLFASQGTVALDVRRPPLGLYVQRR